MTEAGRHKKAATIIVTAFIQSKTLSSDLLIVASVYSHADQYYSI